MNKIFLLKEDAMEAKISKAKLLFLETRPAFLLLVPSCMSVGIAAAVYDGFFNGWNLLFAFIGSLLAHVSVNVYNDYYDFKRKTDLLTKRTPFSGGSGFLPQGLVTPKEAFWLATIALLVGLAIGIYFILTYPQLLIIVILSALIVVSYTPVLTKIGLTELFPGFGFGPLLIIGSYITQLSPENVHISATVIAASIPAGILVSNLLFVNEIPDFEADIKTGRRHAVILLGKKASSVGYVVLLSLTYISIIVPVLLKILPIYCLLGLLTIPVAGKASQSVLRDYEDAGKITPALGQNVLVTLVTPVLITIGLLIGAF